jgi:hypothetical protein
VNFENYFDDIHVSEGQRWPGCVIGRDKANENIELCCGNSTENYHFERPSRRGKDNITMDLR